MVSYATVIALLAPRISMAIFATAITLLALRIAMAIFATAITLLAVTATSAILAAVTATAALFAARGFSFLADFDVFGALVPGQVDLAEIGDVFFRESRVILDHKHFDGLALLVVGYADDGALQHAVAQ